MHFLKNGSENCCGIMKKERRTENGRTDEKNFRQDGCKEDHAA